MRLAALLLVALLAGCSAPAATQEAPAPASYIADDTAAPITLARPEPAAPAPTVPVSLSLSERWVKPFRALDLVANASGEPSIVWFLELEEDEPRATIVDGEIFVLKASTPDHHNLDGPRAPVAVSDVQPDGRARAIRLQTPGRYQLAADDARLTINVWPGAGESASQAFLFDGRFEPAEIDITPGSRVLLWNQAGKSVDVRETGFAAYVPLEGRAGRVTPIDEGLYRIVALALAGKSRGVASGAFLVDFERPSDRLYAGPYVGEFTIAESGLETPRAIRLRADHPLRELVVRFEAGSLVPVPASVVVALQDEHGALARASSLTSTELVLSELPAGDYTVEVSPEHGAEVWFRIEAEGAYRLPTPARLEKNT